MLSSPGKTLAPWRIGVLFSRTGFMSVIEETQYHGTMFAIEEINAAGGINGRELIPVIYDPGSEAMAFGHFAKRLMIEDNVSTIFGCYTSSSRKAVLPVVERLNGLLWYPTLYEGFEASPNVIYTGAAPNQNSLALCRFLMKTYGNRFYFVGSDYIYPHESNRVMREILKENGGSVAGERYLNIRARRQDFLPIVNEIRRLQPDVIFSTVVGDGTVFLYQAYTEAALTRAPCRSQVSPRRRPKSARWGSMSAKDISPPHLISKALQEMITPPSSPDSRSASATIARRTCVSSRRTSSFTCSQKHSNMRTRSIPTSCAPWCWAPPSTLRKDR